MFARVGSGHVSVSSDYRMNRFSATQLTPWGFERWSGTNGGSLLHPTSWSNVHRGETSGQPGPHSKVLHMPVFTGTEKDQREGRGGS